VNFDLSRLRTLTLQDVEAASVRTDGQFIHHLANTQAGRHFTLRRK